MEKIKNKIQEHPAYSEFTCSNEQFLSDLTGTLRDILNDLNSKNNYNDEIFTRLSETIEISNAVFRTFSNHDGLELILKLKAVSELYKKNLKENSKLVKTAEHVIKKLEEFNTSFYHEGSSDEIENPELPSEAEEHVAVPEKDYPFKWVIFERNGSFFIVQFSILEIIDNPSIDINEENEPPEFYDFRGINVPLTDLMKVPDSEFLPPAKLLVTEHGKYCYAADHTGREIHSTYDMITPMIEPLETVNRLISGRVKIFGRKYLVIRHG